MNRRYYSVLITVLIAAVFLSGCSSKVEEDNTLSQSDKVPVETVEAVNKDIADTTVISGKLKAMYEVNVIPKIPGKVDEVLVELGDRVNKGQVLFALEDEDALLQLSQAEAALAMAEANYSQNKERIENAQKDLERSEMLYKEGAISLQALEQIRISASDAAVDVLEAQFKQARAGYQLALSQYQNTKIESPIEGIVSSVDVEKGNMVSNAAPAAVVVNMSGVVLEGSIGENLVNKIDASGEVSVNIASADPGSFRGVVKALSPAANPRTGLYEIRIHIDNPEHIIKPGMFAQVELVKDKKENAVVIPSVALLTQNGDKYVFIVVDGKAVRRKVATGIDSEQEIEIVSGLMTGDSVIIEGQNYVKDGSPVDVVRGDS